MFRRKVARVFGLICCILLGAAAVQAQLLQGSIRVQAQAVNVSGALVWQVNMQFSPTDVVIDEATLPPQLKTACPQISDTIRTQILSELTAMGRSSFFIDSFGSNYSLPDPLQPQAFFSALGSRLNRSNSTDRPLQFNQTPPIGFTAPARVGETFAEHNWTNWQFEFDVMVLAVTGYELFLRTKDAAQMQQNGDTPVQVAKSMREIGDDIGVNSLSEDEKAIPVTLLYSPDDLQAANGAQRTDAQVVHALEQAAYKAFLELRAAKLQKCTLRNRDVGDGIYNAIANILPGSSANSSLSEDNKEQFGISGLSLIDDVQIKVTPAADATNNQTPNDRDKEIADLLNKTYKPRLLAQPGQIPTKDILDKDTRQLYLVRNVSAVPKYTFEDGVLTYEVERRREIVNLTLTGTGSYSPEYALNGSIAVTGDNLLHRNESLSLSLTGGNALQQGKFSFSIPRETPKERRRVPIIFAGFGLNASYLYDSDQRLGNPPLTQLSNRESQISAKLSFEYDSFTDRDFIEQAEGINEKRKRLHHLVTTDLGFDLQNSNLKSNGELPLIPPLDGRVAYPSLNVRYLGAYDMRRAGKRSGIGEIDFLLTGNGQKGLTTFGADFDYRQYELSGGAQIFFGFTSTTNLFLRYQRGVGASSSGTPLFKQLRLGGSLNVRGLEEGEFIGNSYAYDRTELGVALLPLLRTVRGLFPGNKKSETSGGAAPNIGGIDLANTYVKVYYDRGRIFDTNSLGKILNPAHGVKGYGIAAELRGIAFIMNKRANLTIGYARSPDSLLHRRGVIVTGLSLDF